MVFDQLKMINQLRKAQKELGKEIVEVDAGGGAVSVQITAELKVKQIKIDPLRVDADDIHELERWLESAINDGYAKAQQIAAEKMQPLLGQMGLGGNTPQ
ncbi:MAG: YbaB/EbfC family nucleoid-associated protein [Candidatus Nomurabacteria bacterium]|jgi:DNA-binding YbaB/EbfC family protein|nr:YbaB/EbfC family nucleoid-associated protein [Candidatus Nomurabacteria bacterium]